MDNSGPVEFIPIGHEGCKYQTHIYANGIKVERQPPVERYYDGSAITFGDYTVTVHHTPGQSAQPAAYVRRRRRTRSSGKAARRGIR